MSALTKPQRSVLYRQPFLECTRLPDTVFSACFPLRHRLDAPLWGDLDIKNPFALLELDHVVQKIASASNSITYNQSVRGAYVLSHKTAVDTEGLIRHNNAVLSTLFQNELPGNPVLWHIVYLYILARNRFPELKDRLFEEIRFLANHAEYTVSLTPLSNPAIYEKLTTCFWYVAHVSHRAFPNDRRNLLRAFPFDPQHFLQFYRDVFEPEYREPERFLLWRLWRDLFLDKTAILPILSHYFHCDRLGDGSSPFHYILYRGEEEEQHLDSPLYPYLTQLDCETVMNVYLTLLKGAALPYQRDIIDPSKRKKVEELWPEPSSQECKLDHIKIHLRTCHPKVICPETNRHWRECIGPYDVAAESNLQMFRMYCVEKKKYPSGWQEFLIFINEYIYRRQKKIPALFPKSIRETLEKVLKIFEKMMEKHSCEEYLRRAKLYDKEEVRIDVETPWPFDEY